MSSPAIRVGGGGGSGRPKPKRPNPVRRIMDREQRIREGSVASTGSPGTPAAGAAAAASSRPQCKNPHCNKSDVRDGHCQNCGFVVYESNIVAEVTFGETASGAAVVHGSYLAADQGSIRPTAGGLAFRRVAGAGASEARERSLREARQLMNQFAHQLQIPPHVADKAFQLYKFASNSNFIQGRRKNTVAAICIYAACRKEENNKVMLIDLADIIKTDVFLLGRSYKELLALLPDVKEGTKPVIIEDLIFRFASKLEFLHDTNKVALSAIRIAQRMRHDNITHGRRPAGICGAALIMAARAHNYRRTVREVVYIAKVTMATLQERMEEFANVPSAQMTIREFHEAQTLPETSHDPPFVYKQSKEWQEKHPKKGKKRRAAAAAAQGDRDGANAAKRQRTAPEQQQAPSAAPDDAARDANNTTTAPAPPPSASPLPPGEGSSAPGADKDGFVVPRLSESDAHDRSIVQAATGNVDDQLEALADAFGDPQDPEDEDSGEELDPSSEMAMAAAQGIHVPGMKVKIRPRGTPSAAAGGSSQAASSGKAGGRERRKPRLLIDEEWELDENNLEKEMQGHLNDPAMIGASAQVTRDIEKTREQESAARTDRSASTGAESSNNSSAAAGSNTEPSPQPSPEDPRFTPKSKVSDDPIIHEDEFKDDPEVMFCKLPEKDVLIKEMIWANHNKDYMRKMQQKIFEAKLSQNGPQKPKRNRARKPRIGEGQTAPAGSATEAAQNMLRTRAISTKLDYSRMGNLFEFSKGGPGSSRSALPSSAGSDAGSESESESEDLGERSGENGAGSPATAAAAAATTTTTTTTTTTGTGTAAPTTRPGPSAAQQAAPPADDEGEGEGDEDDYHHDDDQSDGYGGGEDGYQEEAFDEEDFDPFGDSNVGDDYDE